MKIKRVKCRNKAVNTLQNELLQTLSLSSSAFVRRRVNKSLTLLKQIANIVDCHDSEIESWRIKNIYLARTVQNEKERAQKIMQEKIELQSSYYDILRDKAIVKKELYDIEQTILADSKDIQQTLSKLVEFTNDYSALTVRYNALQKKILHKRESGSLPRSFSGNISFGSNNSHPVSAVNPMIKGCVIQKPTIAVRRLPCPDEQRPSLFQYINVSSPILEEPEESVSSSENRSFRNESRRLGNLTNRRERRRAIGPPPREELNYDDDQIEHEQVSVRMEPVVRLEDVTRLLQNSSLRISETGNKELGSQESTSNRNMNSTFSPEVLLHRVSTPGHSDVNNSENALEECSWIYQRSSPVVFNSAQRCSTARENRENWNKSPYHPPGPNLEADSTNDTIRNINSSASVSFHGMNVDQIENINIQESYEGSPARVSRRTTRVKNLESSLRRSEVDSECNFNNVSTSTTNLNVNESVEALEDGALQYQLRNIRNKKTSKRFSLVNVENLENEKHEPRRSNRPRKSAKLSPESVASSSSESSSNVYRRGRKKRNESVQLTDESLNETIVPSNRESTKSKTMKKSKSCSSANTTSTSSDADMTLTSRPVRSLRTRANISYEEPSLTKKLRRET